jgi:hypothetical protein
MSVYPKVSGLAAWSENCKWYSSLPLGAVVSLFCHHNPLCCFSTTVYCCKCIFRYDLVRKILDTPSYYSYVYTDFLVLFTEIYLRREFSVTCGKELLPSSDIMCTHNLNEIVEKDRKEETKGGRNK